VEAVIGLAPNLFYGTGLAACVLVLKRQKAQERQGKVLIVDASSQLRRSQAQNVLEPEHATQIDGWVQAFADVEDRARVVCLEEVEQEGWSLNISRYDLPPSGLTSRRYPRRRRRSRKHWPNAVRLKTNCGATWKKGAG
jgi:type I restriction enzyme M protein